MPLRRAETSGAGSMGKEGWVQAVEKREKGDFELQRWRFRASMMVA
ncbi:hypothetical protein COLO4_22334 [Corchorus olitorius]|uniref:Uncharacterized protein n=1 Tax=Corchorus olitorius TaxID=93759 RepID=A0A1R3IMT1_9ROSI|nr:hypothetical protein COLO4_22334 [Corchorus olitorius]